MKKSFILAAILLLPLCLKAETIPATDTRVTFVGRTAVEGTAVSFDWTATYFRVAFSGKSLTMKASDLKVGAADETAAAKLHNYYAVCPPLAPHRLRTTEFYSLSQTLPKFFIGQLITVFPTLLVLCTCPG